MITKSDVIKYRHEIIFAGIIILSAFLNIWNIWAQGISNEYYAAAVKSMIQNPGLIFFNSFDPAGFVTIDKPPVGLWVQVASATLFGFSGWSLVLPQALAGVGSVALIYDIVFPRFGKPAGLISGFALAITPISVAVSRNGTMDMVLIFVLLLATLAALKAAKEQSLPYLLLSVVLIGIGFNIKMIQAFIIVPAVLIIYLMGAGKLQLPKQALHVGIAVVVLLSVSLSWAVAVDMVPADQRPYIGGSGDNTVLGLIINYNGIHRLENGMTAPGSGLTVAPPGGGMPSRPGLASSGPGYDVTAGRNGSFSTSPPGINGGMAPPDQQPEPPAGMGPGPGAQAGAGGMDRGPGMQDTGNPGIFRLLSEGLAGQISWLIPFALIGLLVWWRWPLNSIIPGSPDFGLSGEKGMTLTFMVLWLIPGLVYFSFTTGFWHPYYIATIAPPLAALAGIGAVMMYREYCTGTWKGWLLVAAVLITGMTQVTILSGYSEWAGVLVPVLFIGTIAVTVFLFLVKFRGLANTGAVPKIIAVVAIALLFFAPFIWACTPLVFNNGGFLPAAGPQMSRGGMPYTGNSAQGPGTTPVPNPSIQGNTLAKWSAPAQGDIPGSGLGSSSLAAYLISHNTGETWYVAVPGSHEASNLIIDYGIPVMSLGGFSGTDRILTVEKLNELMNEGKIRYFLIPSSSRDNGRVQGDSELYSVVRNQSTEIPATEWSGESGNSQYTLYDLGRRN
jgi:4-amino-4-deoxy-L-arabinose transferase-like glycosyltransferase